MASGQKAAMKAELLELKRQGLAKFPFSDIQIYESLPTDPNNARMGLERIRTIAELAVGQNHPSAWSLMEHEIRQLVARTNRAKKMPVCSPEWFYGLAPVPNPWERARSEKMIEWIEKKGMGRKERLGAISDFEKSFASGKMSKESQAIVEKLQKDFPFLRADRTEILRALVNKTSSSQLDVLLRRGVRDIENFSRWVVENWQLGQVFVNEQRKMGARMLDTTKEYFEQMKIAHAAVLGTDKERIAHVRLALSDIKSEWLSEVPRLIAATLFNKPESGFSHLPSLSFEATPSLYMRHAFFNQLLEEFAMPKGARNPDPQAAHDYFDGLHLVFLPHVDIFRPDKHTASVLRSLRAPSSTIVAEALEDVPALVTNFDSGRKA